MMCKFECTLLNILHMARMMLKLKLKLMSGELRKKKASKCIPLGCLAGIPIEILEIQGKPFTIFITQRGNTDATNHWIGD